MSDRAIGSASPLSSRHNDYELTNGFQAAIVVSVAWPSQSSSARCAPHCGAERTRGVRDALLLWPADTVGKRTL